MVPNKAYARAGFVFFIVCLVLPSFFPGPDRPYIIEDISLSALIASTYCWIFGSCGVPAGRVFSRLPLLGILAIMLLPLNMGGIFKFMMLLTVLATMFLPSLYKWWRQR